MRTMCERMVEPSTVVPSPPPTSARINHTKVAVQATGGGNCEAGLELFALELENCEELNMPRLAYGSDGYTEGGAGFIAVIETTGEVNQRMIVVVAGTAKLSV